MTQVLSKKTWLPVALLAAMGMWTLGLSGCTGGDDSAPSITDAAGIEADNQGYSAADTTEPAQVGSAAPHFEVVDERGQIRRLSDYRGQYVVLEWFNKDCPFVIKHYSASTNMQELQERFVTDDLVWFTVISSAEGLQGHMTPEAIQELQEEWNIRSTAFLIDESGVLGRTYGARTTPHMYLIDPEGVLVYAGAIDSNPSASADTIPGATNYIANAIEAHRAGEAIDPAVTRAYGCSVKYADD